MKTTPMYSNVTVTRIINPNTFMPMASFRTAGGYGWMQELGEDSLPSTTEYFKLKAIREELWRHCLPKKK